MFLKQLRIPATFRGHGGVVQYRGAIAAMAIEEIAEIAIGWGFLCQKKIKPYYLTFLGYEIEMAKTKTETSSITIPNLQKKQPFLEGLRWIIPFP